MVDNASALLHEGWLLNFAVKTRRMTEANLNDRTDAWRIREAVILACAAVDTSPISKALTQLFQNSKGSLNEASPTISSAIKTQGVGCRGASPEAVQEAMDSTQPETRQ